MLIRPSAVDKSFTSEQEAKDFVAGKPVVSKSAIGKPDKFYGVAVGHNPGVYEHWDDAKMQVTDIKGPIYRKFDSREEAEEFVRTKGQSAKGEKASKEKKEKGEERAHEEPAAKKVKVTSAKSKGKSKVLQVYTDGSSRGNGRVGAIAGVGVFFGEGDGR